VSGDVRRALEVCRRAAEIAWEGLDEAARLDHEVQWVGLWTFCGSLNHGSVSLFDGRSMLDFVFKVYALLAWEGLDEAEKMYHEVELIRLWTFCGSLIHVCVSLLCFKIFCFCKDTKRL
jgi:hypothetical protein